MVQTDNAVTLPAALVESLTKGCIQTFIYINIYYPILSMLQNLDQKSH